MGIISTIWFMVAILPYLIFMEGFHMLKKFLAQRGIDFTLPHYYLLFFIVLLIVLVFLKYG